LHCCVFAQIKKWGGWNATNGSEKRVPNQEKIYVCDLRKKPKIKQETHKIMGVSLTEAGCHLGCRLLQLLKRFIG